MTTVKPPRNYKADLAKRVGPARQFTPRPAPGDRRFNIGGGGAMYRVLEVDSTGAVLEREDGKGRRRHVPFRVLVDPRTYRLPDDIPPRFRGKR